MTISIGSHHHRLPPLSMIEMATYQLFSLAFASAAAITFWPDRA
jgi:hypothetical protein